MVVCGEMTVLLTWIFEYQNNTNINHYTKHTHTQRGRSSVLLNVDCGDMCGELLPGLSPVRVPLAERVV